MGFKKIKNKYKYITISCIILTLLLFIIFFSYYKELISKYLSEALNNNTTWFRRQILNNLDYLLMKEEIDENISNTIETIVNVPKKGFKEILIETFKNILIFIINAFNWFADTFYILVLLAQLILIYVIIIFSAQTNKNKTNPTILAKFFILLGIGINKSLNWLKWLLKKIIKYIIDNQLYIKIIIACALFLSGAIFKIICEFINIIIYTNPGDHITSGLEIWFFDCLTLLFLFYLVNIGKHPIINAIVIIVALLVYLDYRAKKNRAQNAIKFNKLFAEVDLHELGR